MTSSPETGVFVKDIKFIERIRSQEKNINAFIVVGYSLFVARQALIGTGCVMQTSLLHTCKWHTKGNVNMDKMLATASLNEIYPAM